MVDYTLDMKAVSQLVLSSVIAEIFVRVEISYSSVRELSYAVNSYTARTVSLTVLYVHCVCMLLNFVLSAESVKSTNLNLVQNFLDIRIRCFSVYIVVIYNNDSLVVLGNTCSATINSARPAKV